MANEQTEHQEATNQQDATRRHHVLRVYTDLVGRGYEVYLAENKLSSAYPIILLDREGVPYLVEIKSARRTKNGNIASPFIPRGVWRANALALVEPNTITYVNLPEK